MRISWNISGDGRPRFVQQSTHHRSEFRPSEICLDFEIRRMNYGAIIIIMKEFFFESAPRNMLDAEVAKAR